MSAPQRYFDHPKVEAINQRIYAVFERGGISDRDWEWLAARQRELRWVQDVIVKFGAWHKPHDTKQRPRSLELLPVLRTPS